MERFETLFVSKTNTLFISGGEQPKVVFFPTGPQGSGASGGCQVNIKRRCLIWKCGVKLIVSEAFKAYKSLLKF